MHNSINPNDYNARLNNTIVCYKGYPVNITVDGPDRFILTPVHAGSQFKRVAIKPTDPDLDVSTPPLGYFNVLNSKNEKVAYFIERMVARRWRQGLCETNIHVFSVFEDRMVLKTRETARNQMYTEGFENMILGKYDSVDRCLKTLTDKAVYSVAASKDIAISRQDNIFNVWYKKDKVGYITPGKNVVKVPSEPFAHIISKFLRELPWVVE